jgi:succinate dehydrogenase / fumarate reductase membrane anchor subunit
MGVIKMNKRNGVREWIFQRMSNVMIFVYAIVYIYLMLSLDNMDYNAWVAMHSSLWFKWYSSITLLIVVINALLAGWQIGTDYTQKVALPGFAVAFHGFYTLVSLGFLVGGFYILWFM